MGKDDIKESVWEHIKGDDYATICTSERWLINHIHRLKKKYPDNVDIRVINNDGSLVVRIPQDWHNFKPPKKVNMSDEQKDEKRRLLDIARKKKIQTQRVSEAEFVAMFGNSMKFSTSCKVDKSSKMVYDIELSGCDFFNIAINCSGAFIVLGDKQFPVYVNDSKRDGEYWCVLNQN